MGFPLKNPTGIVPCSRLLPHPAEATGMSLPETTALRAVHGAMVSRAPQVIRTCSRRNGRHARMRASRGSTKMKGNSTARASMARANTNPAIRGFVDQ